MNWFEHLRKGLEAQDYVQSRVDSCVFLRADSIVLCYVDDCIIIANENHIIDDLVTSFKNGPEKYYFTVKGTIKNYLGVKIVTHQDGSFETQQPLFIKKIVDFIEMSDDMFLGKFLSVKKRAKQVVWGTYS